MIILLILLNQTIAAAQTVPYNEEEIIKLSGPYLGQEPPGSTPKLFAPGIVSKNNQHSSVYFTKDGLEAYYSDYDRADSKIMMIKEVDGRWTMPEKVVMGLTPYLSPDGNKLFFSTLRISECTRTDGGWSAPVDLGNEINFQRRQDGASVDGDGTLYFTSMNGSKDGIYSSKFVNGVYQSPVKLNISVKGNGKLAGYASPSPDGSFLVFQSRTDKTGFGKSDLYVTFQKDDESWTNGINLGSKINTKDNETFVFVSHDGKYLFYNSTRPTKLNNKRRSQSFSNIFWVEIDFINDLKPEELKNEN